MKDSPAVIPNPDKEKLNSNKLFASLKVVKTEDKTDNGDDDQESGDAAPVKEVAPVKAYVEPSVTDQFVDDA